MGQIRHLGGRRWPLALTVSLISHTVVVGAVGLTQLSPSRSEDPVEPLVVWLSDWRPPPPEAVVPEEIEPAPVEAEEPEPIAEPAEPDEVVDAEEAPATDAESEKTPAPSRSFTPIRRAIDWRAEARRAVVMAREARERSESYVTFGFPFDKRAGLDSRTGENLAELESRYGNGGVMPERDANGDLVVYDDNGCFQIVGTGSILLEDSNRFSTLVPMGGTRCSRSTEPRSDLFEAQKPGSLR
ncbi:MAG TPA: hypothetical protein VIV14_03360 [Gammaproteobacteria bacterium]